MRKLNGRPTSETFLHLLSQMSGFITVKELAERTGYNKSLVCKVVKSEAYPATMILINSKYEKLVAVYPALRGKEFPFDLLRQGDENGQILTKRSKQSNP
jgi:hypothetical protein